MNSLQITVLLETVKISHTMFLAATFAIYFLVKAIYRLFFSPLSKIPGSRLSKLTMAKMYTDAYLGRSGDSAQENYYTHGDIYTLGSNLVILSNPADCNAVLSTHRFAKGPVYESFALIEDTMFTTRSPDLARTRRKQLGPAFTMGHLAEMEPVILKYGIEAICAKWDSLIAKSPSKATEVCFIQHFALAAFDVIGALGYGQEFNALHNDRSQVISWVNDFNALAMLKLSFGNPNRFPNRVLFRNQLKSISDLVIFGNKAAQKRRDELSKGLEKPKDILQVLIDCESPDSKIKMTPLQITAENVSFLMAGTNTISLTLSWIIHYLMLHPKVYQKAVSEVRSVFSSTPDHTVTFAEAKSSLPYIDACICESMRIRAVSGVPLLRVVPKGGATFQGYFLPERTLVGINIAGINHHKDTWESPRKFIPERFINNEKLKQNVLTFSSGVRMCPGRNLANCEILTILANILLKYDFENPKDALFGPENLDIHGNPKAMPCTLNVTISPKYPDRDCRVIIRKAHFYK